MKYDYRRQTLGQRYLDKCGFFFCQLVTNFRHSSLNEGKKFVIEMLCFSKTNIDVTRNNKFTILPNFLLKIDQFSRKWNSQEILFCFTWNELESSIENRTSARVLYWQLTRRMIHKYAYFSKIWKSFWLALLVLY